MSYEIRFPSRRLEAVFGTAYPGLGLADYQKIRFLQSMVSTTHGLKTGYSGELELAVKEKLTGWTKTGHDYTFKISMGKREGYAKAVAIEQFLYSIPRLGILSPPRFWNKWFRSARPNDTFLITELDHGKIFQWLQDNVTYSDYQIYSKFGEDISLGFRNSEYATLFKLTFGDQDI